VLDRAATFRVVATARPDAIVYQATALAGPIDFTSVDRSFGPTNRLRTEGTDNLLAAAREVGVSRLVAQSYAPYRYARQGGFVKSEDDPLDAAPIPGMEETVAAMNHLDQVVTEAGGIALRYGGFYGDDNVLVKAVRERKYPIVGGGEGVTSFIHLDDAASATVLALGHEGPAIYNVVDDEPARLGEWLPELARALGARAPRRYPRFLARLFAGEGAVVMATQTRGAANAKAKRELGWQLKYPSWRQGFVAAYGPGRTSPVA
jgi:nucleoside-diphosphate-sugar epimerase